MEVVNQSGSGKVTYKSKKVKKETSPIFGDRLNMPGITRKQVASGFFVGKPIIIDFFDWNQFQKHTFLGRALIGMSITRTLLISTQYSSIFISFIFFKSYSRS